jgi:hypothetical protein
MAGKPYNSGNKFRRINRPDSNITPRQSQPGTSGNTTRNIQGWGGHEGGTWWDYGMQHPKICQAIDKEFGVEWDPDNQGFQICNNHNCCNVTSVLTGKGACVLNPLWQESVLPGLKRGHEYVCMPKTTTGYVGTLDYIQAAACNPEQVNQQCDLWGFQCRNSNACGCMDDTAHNYVPYAQYPCSNENGQGTCCIYPHGCADPTAYNYYSEDNQACANAGENCSHQSSACIYEGCTDPTACNYNPAPTPSITIDYGCGNEWGSCCEYTTNPDFDCDGNYIGPGVVDPDPEGQTGDVVCTYCDEGCSPQYESWNHCINRCQELNPDADSVDCVVNPCICKYCVGCLDNEACNFYPGCYPPDSCCTYDYYPEWGCIEGQCIRPCGAGPMSEACPYGNSSTSGNNSCCQYWEQNFLGTTPCDVVTGEGDCVPCCPCGQHQNDCGACVSLEARCDCCGNPGGVGKWQGDNCRIIDCADASCNPDSYEYGQGPVEELLGLPGLVGQRYPCKSADPCHQINWRMPETYRGRKCYNADTGDCFCNCAQGDGDSDCCDDYICRGTQVVNIHGSCWNSPACIDWLQAYECEDIHIPDCSNDN